MKSMLKSLMSVAAAALALTSCSTDATEEVLLKGESKTLEVNASIEQTRTAMAANHIDLEWSEGDEIYLYIGADTTKADVIKHTIGDKITNVTYNEGDMVYANYSLNNSYSNGAKAAEINIKNAQNQTEANVFAGENLPMVATGIIKDGKVDLTFKPVGCVLVFNVYGPAENEKIKSIKFETSVGCCGYDYCDLTAETLVYEPYKNNTSAAVTLGTPAAIGSSKPNDTQIGENQVYLVVAPVNYPAGSKFVVTTDAGETYTFETSSAIDCTTKTARVVNLNLAKAPEMKPAIEVPAVPQQESAAGDLQIEGIVFKHFAASEVEKAEAGVYSDAELTQPLDNDAWLTISNDANLASGSLNCRLAANETAEDRAAYIGIKCGGVQAAIAIKQVAQGGSTEPVIIFEEHFDGLAGDNITSTGSGKQWTEYSPKFSAATNVYQAGEAIKLGTSKKTGSITTQELDLSTPVTLEFKVKGWTSIEGKIAISVDGTVKGDPITYTAKMGDEFEQISLQLDAATNASTITIATTAKRAFIDDIVVKK